MENVIQRRFRDYLDRKHIEYVHLDGPVLTFGRMAGERSTEIDCVFDAENGSDLVELQAPGFWRCERGFRREALEVCNELNRKYPLVKFTYIDGEYAINASCALLADPETCAKKITGALDAMLAVLAEADGVWEQARKEENPES